LAGLQFGSDHVGRYFSGSSRVVGRIHRARGGTVQIDGTQRPDGAATRQIMVYDGNTEALGLS
jgi:hypothetical protein